MAWRLAALLMVAAVMSVASGCGGDDSVSLPEPPTEQVTVGGDPVDESSPAAGGDSTSGDDGVQQASDENSGTDLPEPVATPTVSGTADENATAEPAEPEETP
jgi:hypothetical protein